MNQVRSHSVVVFQIPVVLRQECSAGVWARFSYLIQYTTELVLDQAKLLFFTCRLPALYVNATQIYSGSNARSMAENGILCG